eukprot:TRINITY_DN42097_c0_g1_i1.p1 TRINITY_DN42097_c0_g1~~TRINITY_DN42097_c0_g1_i1.p1  ORF type:complete len:628 (+),score=103.06 TRINITY_DN42097_c0_g1_i1:79-1962(+)
MAPGRGFTPVACAVVLLFMRTSRLTIASASSEVGHSVDDSCSSCTPVVSQSLLSRSVYTSSSVQVQEELGSRPSSFLQESMRRVLGGLYTNPELTALIAESEVYLDEAGVRVTPEVGQALEKIIGKIRTDMEVAIKTHHNLTQQRVDQVVKSLDTRTATAVTAHGNAAEADRAYVECARQANKCFLDKEACDQTSRATSDTKESHCRPTNASQFYRSNESSKMAELPVLVCDYSKSPSECNIDHWKNSLLAWADASIKPEIDAGRVAWDNRVNHTACLNATVVHDDQQTYCQRHGISCRNNAIRCQELLRTRDVAMCIFGNSLQEKCEAKADYETLRLHIREAGNAHSDVDRRKEWRSGQLIKCMLIEHSNGSEFDSDTMQSCENKSNYDEDVGTLDLHSALVRSLNEGANFDCVQTAINFSGVDVVVAGNLSSTSYAFHSPYQPNVNLETGNQPFPMCVGRTANRTAAGLPGANHSEPSFFSVCHNHWQITVESVQGSGKDVKVTEVAFLDEGGSRLHGVPDVSSSDGNQLDNSEAAAMNDGNQQDVVASCGDLPCNFTYSYARCVRPTAVRWGFNSSDTRSPSVTSIHFSDDAVNWTSSPALNVPRDEILAVDSFAQVDMLLPLR